MKNPTVGLTTRAFVNRLRGKKKPERKDEFFGSITTTLANRLRIDIEGLTDDELTNLLTHELIRRNVKDCFLGDLGKKIQKRKIAIKLEDERKQKEAEERIKRQKSPFNQFRLLAQQNSVTRIEALNEWSLNDLKDVLRQIANERRLEGVSDHMLRQAKVDLVRVIQEKTALGE